MHSLAAEVIPQPRWQSASFRSAELLRALAGLYAELSSYSPARLWRWPKKSELGPTTTMAAEVIAASWRAEAARLRRQAEVLDNDRREGRFKFDLHTVLRDAEGEILRRHGSLVDRAMRMHQRLEQTMTLLAEDSQANGTRDMLVCEAQVQRRLQERLVEIGREVAEHSDHVVVER